MTRRASRVGSRPELLALMTAAASADHPPPAWYGPDTSAFGWKRRKSAPGSVGIYGLFGCGNAGNGGTLEAMLNFLREVRPDAELVCICAGPRQVTQQLRVAAIPIGFPMPSHALLRALLAGPRKLGCFARAIYAERIRHANSAAQERLDRQCSILAARLLAGSPTPVTAVSRTLINHPSQSTERC